MRKILGCIKKADRDFHLIENGDRIAVGVSGGKDSTLLLYALSLYQKMHIKEFELIGIHVEMGFPDMDFTELDTFLKTQGIPFYHEPSQIYEILQINKEKDGRLKCSLCSKFKKASVIETAKKHGCNKIAFAHHADDAIETLVMNAIFGGRLATFKPNMYMDRTDTTFIRPFVYAFESDIENSIRNNRIPVVTSTCPMDKHTQRQATKEMLEYIYRKYPQAKENFLKMLHNKEQVSLWAKELDK